EEIEAWRRLQSDVARSQTPIDKALRLSRVNRNDEAHQVMRDVEPIFEDISRDVSTSIEINTRNAHAAQLAAQRLQRRSLLSQLVLLGLGLGITLVVAIRITRQFARADERERQAFAVLERRNRELDAFAARVAHDFRAPLTSVKMAASLVRKEAPE